MQKSTTGSNPQSEYLPQEDSQNNTPSLKPAGEEGEELGSSPLNSGDEEGDFDESDGDPHRSDSHAEWEEEVDHQKDPEAWAMCRKYFRKVEDFRVRRHGKHRTVSYFITAKCKMCETQGKMYVISRVVFLCSNECRWPKQRDPTHTLPMLHHLLEKHTITAERRSAPSVPYDDRVQIMKLVGHRYQAFLAGTDVNMQEVERSLIQLTVTIP